MSHNSELTITGRVQTRVPAYARRGAPSLFAPVASDLPAGSAIAVCALVTGDAVEGNSRWYRISEDAYVWAGACTRLSPCPAFPQEQRMRWKAVVFEVR